jgi:hypothetical protein
MCEVMFNAFATKWVVCVLQNNGIDDLMTGNLGCQKCVAFRKI